jgi:DNA-binding transcriptional MerR regulator
MTATAGKLRIGEVAARLGTTPRTLRYYEEVGLLPAREERDGGAQRCYTEPEVERIAELLRLKELLGLSLEAMRGMLEAGEARRLLRERYHHSDDAREQAAILTDSLGHIEHQLALVTARREQLARLEQELEEKRDRVNEVLSDLRERRS